MSKFLGSQYKGEKVDNLPHGKGVYKFPNGTIYEGEFDNGNFHGKGKLIYQDKGVVEGQWKNGKLIDKQYFFSDQLKYQQKDWNYCNLSDRRFNIERNKSLKPFGEQNLCNQENFIQKIPEGTYDVQNGFLDPQTKLVYNYEQTEIKYKANEQKIKNYVSKYRYNPQQEFINKINGVFQQVK